MGTTQDRYKGGSQAAGSCPYDLMTSSGLEKLKYYVKALTFSIKAILNYGSTLIVDIFQLCCFDSEFNSLHKIHHFTVISLEFFRILDQILAGVLKVC